MYSCCKRRFCRSLNPLFLLASEEVFGKLLGPGHQLGWLRSSVYLLVCVKQASLFYQMP